MSTKAVVVRMKVDKITKGTIRFAEVPIDPNEPNFVGVVYIPKATVREFALGEHIEVTIKGVK